VAVKRKTVPASEATQAPAKKANKQVPAMFFRTEAGGEPVREWLKSLLSREDRKRVGEDIKTVEFGAFLRRGLISFRTASPGCFSTSTRRAAWFSCMTSSRKRRRRR
jgi:hypothetical protein